MAKTLLSIIQQVTGELKLTVPSVVLTSDDKTIIQLTALVVSAMDDLMDEFDWQNMLRVYSFTTVPGQEFYPLPADYQRAVPQTFWNQSESRKMVGSVSPVEWECLKNNVGGTTNYRFRVINNKMQLNPVPATAQALSFEYQSNAAIWDSTVQNYKQVFSLDSDQPAFAPNCITKFTKLKWLEANRFDTTAALVEFNNALEIAKGADVPGGRANSTKRRTEKLIGLDNLPDRNWG